MDPSSEPPGPQDGLPPSLRFLKWLVIVLTLTMIGGVITVVALLVTRIPDAFGRAGALPRLPDAIELPQGAEVRAATFGTGWVAVVVAGPGTAGERILVFSPEGALLNDVALVPGG